MDRKLFNSVNKEILKYKNNLRKSKIVENFGQQYVRELKSKYFRYEYDIEDRVVFDLINEFSGWCENYCGQ